MTVPCWPPHTSAAVGTSTLLEQCSPIPNPVGAHPEQHDDGTEREGNGQKLPDCGVANGDHREREGNDAPSDSDGESPPVRLNTVDCIRRSSAVGHQHSVPRVLHHAAARANLAIRRVRSGEASPQRRPRPRKECGRSPRDRRRPSPHVQAQPIPSPHDCSNETNPRHFRRHGAWPCADDLEAV